MLGKDRAKTIFNRKIPAIESFMVFIERCQFLHNLKLTLLNHWIKQIIILIFCPTGTHKNLHAMFGSFVKNRINGALQFIII